MTEVKFKNPKTWLDTQGCENIYETFRKAQTDQKLVGEPLPPFVTRYKGVLESIVESVRLKANLLDYDVAQTAVTYYIHLARSQAFLNGNKRMSVILTDTFLYLNDYTLTTDLVDLADLTLMISEDHNLRMEQISELLLPTFRGIVKWRF